MADSPILNSDGPVGLKITANGAALADDVQVISVRTRAEMFRVPEALIVIADGDVAENTFPVTDADTFKPGSEVEIEAFYGDGAPGKIFSGIVTDLRLRIVDERGSRLEVTVRDKAVRLTLAPATATFAGQTDSAALSKIVSDAGLTADVDGTSTEHETLVQYLATPWDFIVTRAEANGMLVWSDAGTVKVKTPPSDPAVLTVTYGEDLIRFDAALGPRGQYQSVDTLSWSLAQQAALSGTATIEGGDAWGNTSRKTLAEAVGDPSFPMVSPIRIEEADLTALAKARQARGALALVRGTASFQGSAKAALGKTVELKGLADRFNGSGLVCAVSHDIEDGQWITHATLGHPAPWFTDGHGLASPAAAGLVAPIDGLQVGLVQAVTEDPKGEAMIKISVPMLGAEADPLWARYAAPYASNGAGVMFLPEVNDEVIVGFMNADPGFPVVLGSVHSSKNVQPATPDQPNNTKTILTREKLEVTFDDENKVITVATPGGNSVTLSDQDMSIKLADQNGNTVELSSAGIKLDSASDVTVTATGSVTISGSTGVTVSSDADVSLSGLNVSASADAAFSASGNASSELTASGQVTVQGALVNIN